MLKLALRNVFRQRLRTAMTLAAIMFGVVALIVSGGFVQDVYHQLAEALIHSQSGHAQVARSGYHDQGSRSPEHYLIEDTAAMKEEIARIPGVDDVMERVSFSGLLNNDRSDWPIVGLGVEPEKEAALGTQLRLTAGRQLSRDDDFGILVGEGVARALGLSVGDPVTLLLNTIDGALNSLEFDVVGVFQTFSGDFDARAVSIPMGAARELLGTEGVNALVVSLQRTRDTDRVVGVIGGLVADAGLEVRNWRELNDFYESTVALYQRQFGVLQLIIMILVLLGVANSVNMSAFERVGEFGTLMAVGSPSAVVLRLVIVENVVLGLVGAVLGVVAGSLLALSISAVGISMPPPPGANLGYTAHIRLVPAAVLTASLVGFSATVLASFFPAWRVSRIPVVDALRQNH